MNNQTVEQVKATSKNFVSNQIDERSTAIGTQIASTADNLRTIGDNLRSTEGAAPAAQLADRIADYVERFGSYLRESDSDRLLADVEQFSRERPWAVATGALIAGFAASRFIKSTSALRYRTGGSSSGGNSENYGRSGMYDDSTSSAGTSSYRSSSASSTPSYGSASSSPSPAYGASSGTRSGTSSYGSAGLDTP